MDIDIIALDLRIHEKFKLEREMVPEYIKKICDIKRILEQGPENNFKLRKSLVEYESRVDNIQSENEYTFYIGESIQIIEQYKRILKTPVKISFLGNNTVKITEEKEKLIADFLQIAKKYIPIVNHKNPGKINICDNCSKKNISEGVCVECGYEKEANGTTVSYKDVSRTNILQKYTYERRTHFRDCINQFQGKQNCKIDKKVYDDIEEQLDKHHLLVGDKNTPNNIRFSKIQKEHIMIFLKELGYDKHYENSNFIYSKLSGVKCPDISHLEDQLMADFETVVNLYIKKFKYENRTDRKSFMNIQYVFFQLLNKNKYKCKKEDFNILKTIDRKAFHDEVFRELFEELGWNHTPFF